MNSFEKRLPIPKSIIFYKYLHDFLGTIAFFMFPDNKSIYLPLFNYNLHSLRVLSMAQDSEKKIFFFLIWLRNLYGVEIWDFLGGSVIKNLPANAGDMGLIPALGRSHML